MAKRPRNPALEKAKDYAEQSVNLEEYPKRGVVSRSKKKKGVNRVGRRKVKQLLHEETPLREDQEHRLPESLRQRRVPKTANQPLGKALEYKRYRRGSTVGFNFLKQPYSSLLHRERFAAFLEALTQGESDKAVVKESARYFAVCLEPDKAPRQRKWLLPKQQWLEAFFNDEPSWRGWLVDWVEKHQSSV